MAHTIEIHTPDGRTHERVAEDRKLRLSAWLENEHLPLNTRCGEGALCRGCFVEIDGKLVRACRTKCGEVGSVTIPESSLRDHRINGVSSFEIGSSRYAMNPRAGIGLSVDIGTTTVAAALWNLQSGECLATGSVANEQRRYGDNVLTRIDHAISVGGASKELQTSLVRESLQPLIERLCEEADLSQHRITEAVAAGNTVMQHSILAQDLAGFAAYPFRPKFIDAQHLDSASLGFDTSFPLQLAANLGPFVGADIAVGALASGMLELEGPALLIDFGTNGEILLKTKNGYLGTATAAGPAFEGGRLSCGSAAGEGVISSLQREDDSWKIRFTGNQNTKRSTGIAGAAYVDFMRHSLEAGILNEMGRFNREHPEVFEQVTDHETKERTELRVKLHQKQFVSESDIAELIQAKAAISAGVMALLEEADLEPEDLETVYIAGGFGYHLNCSNAMAIGMIPMVEAEKIQVIGNASLGGASLILQADCASEIEKLQRHCKIVELNQLDGFEDHFIDCMPLDEI